MNTFVLVSFPGAEMTTVKVTDVWFEGAVKVAVHRFRQRYRELLREEIAQTVATPAEVEAEVRYLISVLART